VSPLSRRFLITAATMLLAGIVIGFVMLWQREFGRQFPGPLVVSAHAHLILVGTVLEAIFGTAVWPFPRPARGQWQAPAMVGEIAWATLSAGTVTRATAEMLQRGDASALLHWLTVVGAGLQVVGIAAGLVMLQPRIRASVARVSAT
jgi:hypothetical protein